jgi:two-component system, OmpR family, response regulator
LNRFFMADEHKSQYVFLVDDEPIQNEMLKDHISERFDYQLKVYDSGEDALKDIHLQPAIVVLDFHLNSHLPNAQNGLEVLRQIKEKSPHSEVIMLSGQDKLDVAVDSMKYGAYDYVVKGETAFSRVENILNNIIQLHGIKAANNSYKRVVAYLIAALVVVLLVSVCLVIRFKSYG